MSNKILPFLLAIVAGMLSMLVPPAHAFTIWENSQTIGPAVLQWQSLAISDDGSHISGTVMNGQIYVSTDSGQTFTARNSNRGWRGIAMSENGQYQTAVVFGATGVPGYIYRSTNYGATWTQVGINKRWLNVGMSENGQYQTAVSFHTAFGGFQGRVLTSSDYGVTWSEVSALNNRTFGGIAVSETGQYQIISDTTRKVLYSSDYGATWTQILETTNNYVQGLAMSADGMYMTAVEDGGNIWISSDRGANWTEVVNTKAWINVEMSSDGQHQTAVSVGSKYMAVSSDYGQTWTSKMPLDVEWTASAMSANGAYQVVASYVSGSNSRIYKSTATCALTYSAGANGSITGATPQTVDYGTSGSEVTAAPADGYHFVDWSDASTDNPRTDTNVTGDVTVTANFEEDGGNTPHVYPSNFSIDINNGANCTTSREVILTLRATNASWVVVDNNSDFRNSQWESFGVNPSTKKWTLLSADGAKTVYVMFKSSTGDLSFVTSGSITLDEANQCAAPNEVPEAPPSEAPTPSPPPCQSSFNPRGRRFWHRSAMPD